MGKPEGNWPLGRPEVDGRIDRSFHSHRLCIIYWNLQNYILDLYCLMHIPLFAAHLLPLFIDQPYYSQPMRGAIGGSLGDVTCNCEEYVLRPPVTSKERTAQSVPDNTVSICVLCTFAFSMILAVPNSSHECVNNANRLLGCNDM